MASGAFWGTTEGRNMESLPEHSREVAKGSFWNLLGGVAFKLISFFYVVLIARAASQDDVGLFYLSLSILALFGIAGDLGISSAIVRYVPYFGGRGEKSKIRDMMVGGGGAFTAATVFVSLLVFWQAGPIGALYNDARLADLLRVMSMSILLGNLLRLNTSYLQGMADIKAVQFYSNAQHLLKLVFTVVLFYLYGASVATISLAYLLSFAVALAVSSAAVWPAIMRLQPAGPPLTRQEVIGEMLPLGATIALTQSFAVIISSSDRMILGYLTPPASAGPVVAVYSVATTFAFVIMTLPSAINGIFLPVVSRLVGKNDMDGVRSAMATSQRWTMFVTIPAAMVMLSFPAEILSIFYGEAYAPGALSMALFTLGLVLCAMYSVIMLALAAMRLVRVELLITVVSGAAALALTVLLVPQFGMDGAALAALAGFLLALAMAVYYGKKLIGFSLPAGMWKMLAAGAAGFAVVLAARSAALPFLSQFVAAGTAGDVVQKVAWLAALAALMAVSAAIFLLSAMFLKCFQKEDIFLMRMVMRKASVPEPLARLTESFASLGVAGK